MLCPAARKKLRQLISSGLIKSSSITPEYQQHFQFSGKVNQRYRQNNSLQRFRSSLSSVHKAFIYTTAFSTSRNLVAAALVELRLLPASAQKKMYLLREVMQHLSFLFAMIKQDNRRKGGGDGGGDGEQAFHDFSQGIATFQTHT